LRRQRSYGDLADDEEKEIGKLYSELYPSHEEHLRSYPPTVPLREDETGQAHHELYNELFPLHHGELTNVTQEQQARVNQALAKTSLDTQIGGASEVPGKPVPNDPTPIEKARDVGQTLQKSGVTMDK